MVCKSFWYVVPQPLPNGVMKRIVLILRMQVLDIEYQCEEKAQERIASNRRKQSSIERKMQDTSAVNDSELEYTNCSYSSLCWFCSR